MSQSPANVLPPIIENGESFFLKKYLGALLLNEPPAIGIGRHRLFSPAHSP